MKGFRVAAVVAVAALGAGCRENVAEPVDENETVEAGLLRFRSVGVFETNFQVEGAPEFTATGEARYGRWAVAGRHEDEPREKFTVVANMADSTRPANSIVVAFDLPRDTDHRTLNLQADCSSSSCSALTVFYGADPAAPRAEEAEITCELNDGILGISTYLADRVEGNFEGTGLCRFRDDPERTYVFGIDFGEFDVDIVESYRTNVTP